MPCNLIFRFLSRITSWPYLGASHLQKNRRSGQGRGLRRCVGLCILLGVSLLGLSSCKWLGEPSYKAKTIEVDGQHENCFVDFNDLVKDYFSASVSEERVNVFFSCVERSIDDFMRRTTEQDKARGYNSEEIARLLESFVLNSKEGDVYSKRFLLLKRIFVGGDPSYFKREEWQKVKVLWPNIRQAILNTRTLTDSYYFYSQKKDYHKAIIKKQDDFARALDDLTSKLAAAGGEMNTQELLFFKDQILSMQSLQKFRPVFDGLFDMYIGFPSSQPKSWPTAFSFIEKTLRINAHIRRSNLEKDIFTPTSTVYYALVIRSILDAVDYALELNWENPLSQEAVEDILGGLYDSKILFKNVKSREDFVIAIRRVGANLFTTQYDDKWSVTKEDLDFLKYKFNTWVLTLAKVLESYNDRSFMSEYAELAYEVDYIKDASESAQELYEEVVLKSKIYNPMFNDVFSFKTHFVESPEKSLRTETHAVLNHFYQGNLANIVSFFFDTYGKQRGLSREVDKLVTENTVERVYGDIRPIIVAEGIVNPLSCSSGSRSFLEANLFSFSGNGDSKVDTYEAIQWFGSILSAGTTARDVYRGALDSGCAIPGNAKYQNFAYVDAQCFKEYFKKDYSKHLYHIPGFLDFINGGDFDKFYNQYFSMVRTCKNNEYPLSFDEVQYAVALLQYIETLFEVYDQETSEWYFMTRKKNNVLEFSELWTAYGNRFKDVVKRLGEAQSGTELSDMVVDHIFRKLITDKKMPYTPDGTWDSAMWFLGSRRLVDPEPYNRLDIYEIFDSVLTAISGGSGKATADYCQSVKLAWEEYKLNNTFFVKEPSGICVAD